MWLRVPVVGRIIRLLDRSDNTPGPLAVQKIEVPYSRLWLLLLLLPVVAL